MLFRRHGSVGMASLLWAGQAAGGGSIPRRSVSKTQDRRPATPTIQCFSDRVETTRNEVSMTHDHGTVDPLKGNRRQKKIHDA